MVQILNLVGTAWPALTDVDLTNFAPQIGRLIAVRVLARATQTVAFTGSSAGTHSHTFTGSAQANHSHTFTGSAVVGHRHLLRVEVSNPGAAIGVSQTVGQSTAGILYIQTPASETFPTAIDVIADHTPVGTLDGQGAHTPVGTLDGIAAGAVTGTITNVLGMVFTNIPLTNNGLISAGATAAANSAVLSGRQAINLGVAVDSNSMLQVQVMLLNECGGVF